MTSQFEINQLLKPHLCNKILINKTRNLWDQLGCDQSYLIWPDTTIWHQTRPGETRPDQVRPSQIIKDQTRSDQMRRKEARREAQLGNFCLEAVFISCGSGNWQINSLNESNKMSRLMCRFKHGILNVWDSLTIWLEFRTNNHQQITLVLKFDILISNNDLIWIHLWPITQIFEQLNVGPLS